MIDKTEEKLGALARLQTIDSQLDLIHTLRGSLPEEVADLEDDVEGLVTRKERIEADIKTLDQEIVKRKTNIKEFSEQIKKYEAQINAVKNNREFEALSKEIEYANLEILTSDKKIKQVQEQIAQKNILRDDTHRQVEEKKNDLTLKQEELNIIVKETEAEEKKLLASSRDAAKKVEDRIINAYHKIRRNMRNGLAVVSTDREACGGCFAVIPPQLHLEIRQKKRLLVCENCGRLLVDSSFFKESEELLKIHH